MKPRRTSYNAFSTHSAFIDQEYVGQITFIKGSWSVNPRRYQPAHWLTEDGEAHASQVAAIRHCQLVNGLGF